jgi:hypothetical protein
MAVYRRSSEFAVAHRDLALKSGQPVQKRIDFIEVDAPME